MTFGSIPGTGVAAIRKQLKRYRLVWARVKLTARPKLKEGALRAGPWILGNPPKGDRDWMEEIRRRGDVALVLQGHVRTTKKGALKLELTGVEPAKP